MFYRRITSALMCLAVALISAAFVPVLHASAVAWWCGGLATMLVALGVAARANPERGRPRAPRSAGIPLAFALVLSLAAFGTAPGSPEVPSVDFNLRLRSAADLEVTHGIADLGAASYGALHSVANAATGSSR
jgi:hypothetical protein